MNKIIIFFFEPHGARGAQFENRCSVTFLFRLQQFSFFFALILLRYNKRIFNLIVKGLKI